MNFLKILLVLAVAGGAYHQWKQRAVESGIGAANIGASSSGFVELPPAADQRGARVFVVAQISLRTTFRAKASLCRASITSVFR